MNEQLLQIMQVHFPIFDNFVYDEEPKKRTLLSEYHLYFLVSLATASRGIFLLYYLLYQKDVAILSSTFCLPY